MMRTAVVRDSNGSLQIKRYDDYKSNAEFAEDLRGNGDKVLEVLKGHKSEQGGDDLVLFNKKKLR